MNRVLLFGYKTDIIMLLYEQCPLRRWWSVPPDEELHAFVRHRSH
jgi:hypothetical protein